jgi:hypothetical protein
MRTRIVRGIILIAGVALFALLATTVLSNTQLRIEGSSTEDGRMVVETQLPQARCSKELSTSFPFVRFHCAPGEP